MLFWIIPLSLGVLSLSQFLYFRVKGRRLLAVILKGLTSLLFIDTALVAWLTNHNTQSMFGLYVVLGLFFGLLGDVFLDLKYMSETKADLFTRLGFIAFGIGHIFYLTGLFVCFYNFSSSVLYIIIPAIISIVLVVLTLLMEKFTKIRYGNMKAFAVGYGLILFFVTTMYFSTCIQSGWQNNVVIIMAMSLIMFALSDLILNNTYFAPGFNTPAFVISNHICYYIAQFVIAISLFFLV